jgi:hypothetical protein
MRCLDTFSGSGKKERRHHDNALHGSLADVVANIMKPWFPSLSSVQKPVLSRSSSSLVLVLVLEIVII